VRDSNRKIIYLQWVVIVVLIVGAAVGGYMVIHKADDLQQSNDELGNSNSSLRQQLLEARQSPEPSDTPSPSSSVSPSPSASPSPTASPHSNL
jgi:Tfp pilus assembly protein PilN